MNVEYKWWGELQKPICRRRVPIILVATKSDLRRSGLEVATEEGMALCNRINARAFLECSASTQANIAEVIYESVRAAVRFSSGTEREPSIRSRRKRRTQRGIPVTMQLDSVWGGGGGGGKGSPFDTGFPNASELHSGSS